MYPSSFDEAAGIFVHEQVKALIKKGVEVRVISPIPWTPFPINRIKGKWRKYSQVPSRAIWDDVEIFYSRYLAFPGAWFFASSGKRMHRGIKEMIERIYQEFPFDLIHAHVALPDG
ncbi:glycosyltransferase family 4 protein, partial [Patescibacteria group bacterium]|nr:glycosyltransferase family 4 protein [Patescibacteria group bacterium]